MKNADWGFGITHFVVSLRRELRRTLSRTMTDYRLRITPARRSGRDCRFRMPVGQTGILGFGFSWRDSFGTISRFGWIFVWLFFYVGCAEKIKPSVTSTGVGQDVPTQESWNSTVTFTDSGRVTAIVHAGHIAVYTNSKVTLLDGKIKVDFFNEREEHTSVLTADRGKVYDATRDLEARDNVVVVSDSGTTLKSQELYWSDARRLIYTQAFVEITSPTEQIQGHGLESDQSLTNYRIFRVSGQAKTNE